MKIKVFPASILRTNVYLVYNETTKEGFLIDPAKGFKRIFDFCDKNSIKIKAVLITHGHFDHILEASLWQKIGARLYIHKNDVDKLTSEKNLSYMIGANVPPVTADVIINDLDELCIAGLKIKVLHTPGHSSGSVCFVIDDIIFSGDTLFMGDYGRYDFPDGCLADLKESIRRLFSLSGDFKVYPGHDEETTLQKERESNAILPLL